MKVLMILERDFPADDRVEKEALSLIKDGHQVDIICFTMNGTDRIENYKGIRTIKRRISKFIYKSSIGALSTPFYFNFWRKILSNHLKNESYQVLHLHDLPLASVVKDVSLQYKITFVLDLHENYPALLRVSPHTKKMIARLLHSNRQWEKYEQKYVGLADKLVTVVEEMKARIRPYAKCEIAVVENTPYLEELLHYDLLPDKGYITLVYSGGLNFHRGLQTVIEGLKLAVKEKPAIRLFILGGGSYEPLLKDMVKDNKLEESVHFFGWVSPAKMFENIYKSDIGLIPHIKSVQSDNSSPNKLFQYMFCGKPILASNCNSVARVLDETNTGITYIHDSAEDFKNRLLELINKMPFDGYIKNGMKAMEKYNWECSVKQLLDLYRNIEKDN
jgi:glycosyltransferase involved in cell wall biosynthesis